MRSFYGINELCKVWKCIFTGKDNQCMSGLRPERKCGLKKSHGISPRLSPCQYHGGQREDRRARDADIPVRESRQSAHYRPARGLQMPHVRERGQKRDALPGLHGQGKGTQGSRQKKEKEPLKSH